MAYIYLNFLNKMNNKISFNKIKECFNIEITHGESVNHFFPPHFHESYNIGIVENGKIVITIENDEYILEKEFCYYLNPKEVHSLKSGEDVISYYVISIPKEEVDKIIGNEKVEFKEKVVKYEKNSNVIKNFISMSFNKQKDYFELQTMIVEILQNVLTITEKKDKKESIFLIKAEEYINNNYKENFDLTLLSDSIDISPFHLIREFKKYSGISPFDYLIQKRVKEAKKLLKSGVSLAEVALDVGFYDQSHFIKYFKKHTGLTPKKYIK